LFLIVANALVIFFAASLITWSSLPGAALFASIFVWTAGYHGHLHRVTLTEPMMAIGTLLGGAGALLLNPDPEHVMIFSVVVPAGATVEVIAGTVAVRRLRIVAEADRLRAAVAAQILDQQDAEVTRISQTLVDVLACNHDMNNALMSACLAADEIAISLGTHADEELKLVANDLRQSLEQIRLMMAEVRESGTAGTTVSSDAATIEVQPVLDAVTSRIKARFPATRITVDVVSSPIRVQMRGGALNLHRVLDNLVLNACEGNGEQAARNVIVSAHRGVTGASVEIRVEDDGPGFTPELLARSIEGFKTSKAQGTGLGLYTSERIIRASGGSIDRMNRAGGGASVRVILPLETA
jgi:signal transduction histidine kinase